MLTAFLDLCVDLRGISGEKSYTSRELNETTHVDCHILPRLSLVYMTAIQNILLRRGHLHSSELPGNSVDPISYFLIREHSEALTELTESRKLRLPLLVRLVQAHFRKRKRAHCRIYDSSFIKRIIGVSVRSEHGTLIDHNRKLPTPLCLTHVHQLLSPRTCRITQFSFHKHFPEITHFDNSLEVTHDSVACFSRAFLLPTTL